MLQKSFKRVISFLMMVILSACASTVFDLNQNAVKAVGDDNFYGMHIGTDTSIPKAIPVLNDLGVKWTRVWMNVDWGKRSKPKSFQMAKDLKAAGFKVIMVFNQSRVPSYKAVKEYFDWVQTVPGMKEAVDVWEILNELNLPKYWSGTPDEYVNQVLKPAWDSLHPQGEQVLGGSFTAWQNRRWGTSITKKYVNAGYLNYVDYAGSHPYTKTAGEMKTHINAVKKLYGSKPIMLTEWNFKQKSSNKTWAEMLNQVRSYMDDRVVTACYYRLIGFESEGGWPGIVSSTRKGYVPVEPFYSMYKKWPK